MAEAARAAAPPPWAPADGAGTSGEAHRAAGGETSGEGGSTARPSPAPAQGVPSVASGAIPPARAGDGADNSDSNGNGNGGGDDDSGANDNNAKSDGAASKEARASKAHTKIFVGGLTSQQDEGTARKEKTARSKKAPAVAFRVSALFAALPPFRSPRLFAPRNGGPGRAPRACARAASRPAAMEPPTKCAPADGAVCTHRALAPLPCALGDPQGQCRLSSSSLAP